MTEAEGSVRREKMAMGDEEANVMRKQASMLVGVDSRSLAQPAAEDQRQEAKGGAAPFATAKCVIRLPLLPPSASSCLLGP